MSARPLLYYALFSPPSRACLLTSKLINLNLDLKTVDFAKQEHRSEWYLKINPRHTVPVLVDHNVSLCDSHAIVTYLVSQYGNSCHEHLYPKDGLKRAIINERLFYENGTLSQVIKDFVKKIMYQGEVSYCRSSIQLCHEAYCFLESFLHHSTYVAGENLTVADISINPTLITLNKLVPVEKQRYPKIHAWMERLQRELPEYKEINEKGAEQLFQRFESALENNMTKRQ